MSYLCGKLCSTILLEHFGPIVQKVGDCLFQNDSQTLFFIRRHTSLPMEKIKESLCVLIKFGLVTFDQQGKLFWYKIHSEKIITMLRYSRFMFFIKKCSGDECEIIFEEILKQGNETASQVIIKTYQKIAQVSQEPSVENLVNKFQLLVKNQFLIRNINDKPEKSINSCEFDMPKLNISSIIKKIQGIEADPGDSKIYWKVNFDRLIQDLRDEIVVSAVERMIDNHASELMRQLIYLMYTRTASWVDTSNPIPYHEIKDKVKNLNAPELYDYLDQYLQLLVDDPRRFVKRVGDSGGGQFCVDMKEAFAQLAWATIENIVLERFGSKAARIFRLVRSEKFIEQQHIHELIMFPVKEAKDLTYALLEKNYLKMQEIKKMNASAAPSKIFYLFHIDINQVVRMEIEHCYHALYNTIQRRNHEISSNKRMMDKNIRLQTLISNLKEHGAPEDQIEQMEKLITPSEQTQLDKVQKTIKTLGGAELYIEDTLFLLTMYLRYH
ncbi:DNA-directed RNA polymerase III subunit RPC3 [Chelonus insularis]|uniref:DNA-directed RNA polymerase III subunit RPC3 n=1 Tax=Chelonus insularis TaxID=460826 RepID=UPI00158D592D|nr:DNA-directed RNA polymerase III subunit RPC3 [Chelonus insularis]